MTQQTLHPQTIKKYTGALLTLFSNIETEYTDSEGETYLKKVPIFYAVKEKMLNMSTQDFSQLFNGNLNYYPRGSLNLESIEPDSSRQTNKNASASSIVNVESLLTNSPFNEVTATPSPYNLNYSMSIITRGMTSAGMIAEQIGAQFRPHINLQIRDGENLSEPSTIKVELVDINFETMEYDEFSNNFVTINTSFILYGNFWKPITKTPYVKEVSINLSGVNLHNYD